MHILLDTHIFIWWLKDDRHLSKPARQLIMNADIVYVSSVSIWEAAIKVQLGKLEVELNELVEAIAAEGFQELPMMSRHALRISTLPQYHRDPFDRMLIAQAMSEPLRLLTADLTLKQYSELVDVV